MHDRSLSFAANTAVIRAMPAGLEMDVAVAKALGYEIDDQALGVPCYSTNHGSGMEALHQFCKRRQTTYRINYDVSYYGLEEDWPSWYISIDGTKLPDYEKVTDSPGLPGLALACCRAILLAAAAAKEKS